MKLNQVIALVSGKKTKAQQVLTAAHHGWQKNVTGGQMRIYTPMDMADPDVPPKEETPVQMRVSEVLKSVRGELSDFWDLVASQETSNCHATADVTVDGLALKSVPVVVLIFLEKQLTDLRTFVDGLPTLSLEKRWNLDANANQYVSEPVEQLRTKKVPKPIVLYPATEQHPAQTQMVTEDIPVGRYRTTFFSGAISIKEKADMLARVERLRDAVKLAREQANSIDAKTLPIAAVVFDFVFNG